MNNDSSFNDSLLIEDFRPRNSLLKNLVLLSILPLVIWLIVNKWDDIVYSFHFSQPIDLGNTDRYKLVADESGNYVPQEKLELRHNALVTVGGMPMRTVKSEKRLGVKFWDNRPKFTYNLSGSPLYIEESIHDSRLEAFGKSIEQGQRASNVVITGRMLDFAEDDDEVYAPLRDFYRQNYGVNFCSDLSPAQLQREKSMLGTGGLIMKIHNKSAETLETGTDAAFYDVSCDGADIRALAVTGQRFFSNSEGRKWRIEDDTSKGFKHFTQAGDLIIEAGDAGLKTDGNGLRHRKINGIKAFDAQRLVAVGKEALLSYSEDGGRNWYDAHARLLSPIRDVAVIDEERSVAVGDNALILYKNATMPYTRANVPQIAEYGYDRFEQESYIDYRSVDFKDNVLAAAGTGNTVLFSEDFGKTWEKQNLPIIAGLDAGKMLNDIRLLSGKNFAAVGEQGLTVVKKDERIVIRNTHYLTDQVVSDLESGIDLPVALSAAYESYTTEDLNAVAWHGEEIWAVGTRGTVLKSNDFGLHFKKVVLDTQNTDLLTIDFFEDTGYIGGVDGFFLFTEDGGKNWKRLDSSTKRDIRRVVALKAGAIFSGTGSLWGYYGLSKKSFFRRSETAFFTYTALDVFDRNNENLSQSRILLGTSDHRVIDLDDKKYDLVSEDGTVSKERKAPNTLYEYEDFAAHDAAFAKRPLPFKPGVSGGHLALALGDKGRVLRSLNGGMSFREVATGIEGKLKSVKISSDGSISAILTEDGRLFADFDAKNAWQPLDCNAVPVRRIFFRNDVLHAVGDQICTLNDRSLIVDSAAHHADGEFAELNGTLYVASHDALRAGERKIFDGKIVALTENGKSLFAMTENSELLQFDGDNHKKIDLPPTSGKVVLVGSDTRYLWIISQSHIMRRGLAPDSPWIASRSFIADFHAVDVAADGLAVAVGDYGHIAVSDDYGKTWIMQGKKDKRSLRAVSLAYNRALAVGDDAFVLKAKLNPMQWTRLNFQIDLDLTAVRILPEGAIIAGKKGAIYRSDDNSLKNFSLVETATTEDIRAMCMLYSGDVIAVGGQKQNEDQICQRGAVIIADDMPADHRIMTGVYLLLLALGIFSAYRAVKDIRSRIREEDNDSEAENFT